MMNTNKDRFDICINYEDAQTDDSLIESFLFLLFPFLLLGAVPFPKDVPRLKQLEVNGVITLNEPYETLVPSSLYHVLICLHSLCFVASFSKERKHVFPHPLIPTSLNLRP